MIRIEISEQPRGILSRIGRGLGRLLGFVQAPTDLWGEMEEPLLALVQQEFDNERDPYGTPWKKSKRAERDGGLTLTDTRKLRQGFRVTKTSKTFAIYNNVPYSGYHQTGVPKRNLVRRAMLPDQGLPDPWARVVAEHAEKIIIRSWNDG